MFIIKNRCQLINCSTPAVGHNWFTNFEYEREIVTTTKWNVHGAMGAQSALTIYRWVCRHRCFQPMPLDAHRHGQKSFPRHDLCGRTMDRWSNKMSFHKPKPTYGCALTPAYMRAHTSARQYLQSIIHSPACPGHALAWCPCHLAMFDNAVARQTKQVWCATSTSQALRSSVHECHQYHPLAHLRSPNPLAGSTTLR